MRHVDWSVSGNTGSVLPTVQPGTRHKLRRLVEDTRGAVMVEYSVVVGAVALGGAVGLIAIGLAVAESFEFVRSLLLCPIP